MHNGQERKKKNVAMSEGPNSDYNIKISLILKKPIMEVKYGIFFA